MQDLLSLAVWGNVVQGQVDVIASILRDQRRGTNALNIVRLAGLGISSRYDVDKLIVVDIDRFGRDQLVVARLHRHREVDVVPREEYMVLRGKQGSLENIRLVQPRVICRFHDDALVRYIIIKGFEFVRFVGLRELLVGGYIRDVAAFFEV